MIFQSVGSNYSFIDAVKQLFATGTESSAKQLCESLKTRYGGTPILYAKGRYALAEAVRLVAENGAVAVNAFTCSVVIEAIQDAGAAPLYVDISENTGHFTAAKLADVLAKNPNINAVIVQNTYGSPVDIVAIEKLCETHGAVLIEDLAHSIGQKYSDGREVGTVGALAMLSFGRDKIIDAANGGALIVNNKKLLAHIEEPTLLPPLTDRIRDRWYPLLNCLVRKTYHVYVGKILHVLITKLRLETRSSDGGIHRHYTLPNWQAARIHSLLQKLPQDLQRRRDIFALYELHFAKNLLAHDCLVRACLVVPDQKSAWQTLRKNGYELDDTWYDTPVGPARKFREVKFPENSCPVAVQRSRQIINLPLHKNISKKQAVQLARFVENEVLRG